MEYDVGDIVLLKKKHPCGSDKWEIMRTGIDFRMKCLKCERVIMVPRKKFERSVKTVLPRTE